MLSSWICGQRCPGVAQQREGLLSPCQGQVRVMDTFGTSGSAFCSLWLPRRGGEGWGLGVEVSKPRPIHCGGVGGRVCWEHRADFLIPCPGFKVLVPPGHQPGVQPALWTRRGGRLWSRVACGALGDGGSALFSWQCC